MKRIISLLLIMSSVAFAIDLNALKSAGEKVAEVAKPVLEACKSEKVEFCPKMTEMAPIKECLLKNKAKLSDTCKKSLGI